MDKSAENFLRDVVFMSFLIHYIHVALYYGMIEEKKKRYKRTFQKTKEVKFWDVNTNTNLFL